MQRIHHTGVAAEQGLVRFVVEPNHRRNVEHRLAAIVLCMAGENDVAR